MRSIARPIVLGAGATAVALGVWAWSSRHPAGPAPAPRSTFSRAVVEPIEILDGTSFDDGGSRGLRFKDASGVVREVCLEDTRVWEDDPNVLEGYHNIYLDSFYPRGAGGRRIPVSGVEEKALLGLLERWAAGDPDARELERRHQLRESGELAADAFWEGLPAGCHIKETAVSILRELRRRN